MIMKDDPEKNFMEWTDDRINRFWEFFSSYKTFNDFYFTKQVGKNIIKFLKLTVPLRGRILDYGCGLGYLSECLLSNGISCEGIDTSKNSVNHVNEQFKKNPLWKGARLLEGSVLPYPDNAFDLIICVEVLEHLPSEKVQSLLQEFHRILKPGTGYLFITTPFSEDLKLRCVYCPECNHLFHPMQHLNSFNTEELSSLLSINSFSGILCNITDFNSIDQIVYPKNLPASQWSYEYLKTRVRDNLLDFYESVRSSSEYPKSPHRFLRCIGKGPHLVWIGAKVLPDQITNKNIG